MKRSRKKNTSRRAAHSKAPRTKVAQPTLRELQASKVALQELQRANPPQTAEQAEIRLLLKSALITTARVRWPKP